MDVVRQGSDSGAGYRRIGVQTTESMEMTLWRPDCRKTVRVSEFRALKQQSVLFGIICAFITGKVKQTEIRRRSASRLSIIACVEDDLETTRQRPEKFQNGNI